MTSPKLVLYLCEHQKQPGQGGFIEKLHIAGKEHRKSILQILAYQIFRSPV